MEPEPPSCAGTRSQRGRGSQLLDGLGGSESELKLIVGSPQGVANRDIKLENILLDESEPRPLIKISDFGFSKVRRVPSHRSRWDF